MIYYFSFGKDQTQMVNGSKTMRLIQPLGCYWQYFKQYSEQRHGYISFFMREYK